MNPTRGDENGILTPGKASALMNFHSRGKTIPFRVSIVKLDTR